MTRNEQLKFVALHSLGNFLVLFSLYGVFATFGPVISEEIKVGLIHARGVEFRVANCHSCEGTDEGVRLLDKGGRNPQNETMDPRTSLPAGKVREDDKKNTSPGFADILAGDKEQVLTVADPKFSIVIPKLGASSKIFPNVDPNNKEAFLPVLQKGVAHAKGSVFPGYSGTTYLFAHSADDWWDAGRYNAVFYTLNNLSENDEIVVFFENRRYNYVVTKKLISDPEDVTYLTAAHTGPNQLVLQTCWPPGTAFKRLYVVAKSKSI